MHLFDILGKHCLLEMAIITCSFQFSLGSACRNINSTVYTLASCASLSRELAFEWSIRWVLIPFNISIHSKIVANVIFN